MEGGNAIPIGIYRNGKFYQVHSDHLGTPRLVTDNTNAPVWQWPYSAFGNNKTTGVLAAIAYGGQEILKGTKAPVAINLRFPGQYWDEESNLNYNYFRSYQPGQGRYTQADPVGLEGGLSRFAYVEGNPLNYGDPKGLVKWKGEMYAVTAISLAGGGKFWFDLKSECVNGKYAYIRVFASALGVGLGIKYTGTGSSISFDDHLSEIYPEGFAGSFKIASAGLGAGLVGGYSAVRLGNNTADFSSEPSPGIGVDASISGLIGRSMLVSKEIKDCECRR